MKTVHEVDTHGKVVRVFHRTTTGAWTHAPGQRYRYRGGRQGTVEMRCDCPVEGPLEAPAEAQDVYQATGVGHMPPGERRTHATR